MSDEVYYKIYYLDREDYVIVVCLQDFDEYDYMQEHFFKDKNGEVLKFDFEHEAIQWLTDNILDDKIDPEYKQYGFNQSKYMK